MTVFQEAEMLRRVPMLAKLDSAKLKLLAFTSRALNFAPGDLLMKVGETADCAYLVLEGEVEIIGYTKAGEFVAAVRGHNEMIGEMGIINSAPRTATVRAKGPVKALRVSGDVFLRLLTENPEVSLDVMRILSDRLAATTRRVEQLQERLQALETAAAAKGT